MTLAEANGLIRYAWIAGILAALITLCGAIGRLWGLDLWNLIDVFFILGLSFGIYKKSRVCVITMFVLFIINMENILKAPPVVIYLICLFGYAFFQGIRGTLAYHKIVKVEK